MGFERLVRGFGRLALDVLLPSQCLTCERPVDGPGRFCPACFEKTSFITAPCCLRCGVPFETVQRGGATLTCGRCLADPPPWSQARAALRYDEQSKRLILPFKYGDRVDLGRVLAGMMARAGEGLLREADWLVPVPLHRRRLIGRRYNQAAVLARALSRLSGRPVLLDALRRVKATSPLAELSPTRRQAELEGAIVPRATRRTALAGSRVLLIDDVLTSGSTARACVAALLEAGVVQVDVLAAARVHSRARED